MRLNLLSEDNLERYKLEMHIGKQFVKLEHDLSELLFMMNYNLNNTDQISSGMVQRRIQRVLITFNNIDCLSPQEKQLVQNKLTSTDPHEVINGIKIIVELFMKYTNGKNPLNDMTNPTQFHFS